MRAKRIFAALLVLPLIATATVAQARPRGAPDAAAWGSGGRQVEGLPGIAGSTGIGNIVAGDRKGRLKRLQRRNTDSKYI